MTENPALSGGAPGSAPPRALGFRDLVLFYLVTGVSLRWIATAAAAGPSSLVVWILAWATFFVPLALSVLELSSRHPDEGGLYVWSKRAFGDFSGFMSAWTYWTSNLPYFPAVLYFAAANALFIGGRRAERLANSPLYFVAFALLGLLLPTVLNILGLNVGKWLNNAGAFGMWLPALMVVVIGALAWGRFGSATHFTAASFRPSFRLKDVIFWSGIWFAFGGCEAGSFMGEEIHDARRTIPRALITAGVCITLAYILGTFFVLLALPSAEVSDLGGPIQAIGASARHLGWLALVPIAAFLITLSNVGQSGAYLAATARLPFVAGIDRYLPPAFGRLHPRWHTPHVAIWAQSLCAMAFVLLGQAGSNVKGAYDMLVSMGVITYFIPFLFLFAAMIKMQREPAGPDVIRVPGGKPTAIALAVVGFATTSAAILLAMVPPPDAASKTLAVVKVLGLTAILLGAGVLVYRRGRHRAA